MTTGNYPIKAGLFGIGLDTYWSQFEGLKPRLAGYQAGIADRMHDLNVELTDAKIEKLGMILKMDVKRVC